MLLLDKVTKTYYHFLSYVHGDVIIADNFMLSILFKQSGCKASKFFVVIVEQVFSVLDEKAISPLINICIFHPLQLALWL